MGFSLHNIGLTNLYANGHNYVTFSLMGMLIVFIGLSLISIYITLLPKILAMLQLEKPAGESEKQEHERDAVASNEYELSLAIAVALHLDQVGGGPGYEKITWKRHGDHESAWLTTGRLRDLSLRSQLPGRRS